MCFNQRKKSIDKFRSLEIADLPQRDFATEVVVAVGVTARALEGTFAGNLDREGRAITAKDSPPRGDNAFHLRTITRIRTDVESRARRESCFAPPGPRVHASSSALMW